MSNLWRTTLDIFPNYAWISIIVDMNEPLYKYVGPGKWNDPDMLEVGVNGTIANQPWLPKTTLTRREARTHFSLWSMMAAPLILGNDLRKVEKWVLDIVTNMDVININQDILGIQGRRMLTRTDGTVFNKCVNPKNGYCLNIEVWTKPLANDNTAVLFWNRADLFDENCPQYKSEDILIRFDEIGLKYKKYLIKDVWANKVMGIFENEFMAKDVLPHGDQLYLFMPKM
jgi:alpha-galactosidase